MVMTMPVSATVCFYWDGNKFKYDAGATENGNGHMNGFNVNSDDPDINSNNDKCLSFTATTTRMTITAIE